MAILNTGNTYVSGDAVTATNLNNSVDQASFRDGDGEAADGTSLKVTSGGYLQVKDLGVTSGKLATDSVINAKIEDGAVTTDKLETSTGANGVTTAKVADDAITLAKMEDGTRGDILSYDSGGEPVRVSIGAANTYLKVNAAGTDVEWTGAATSQKYASAWTALPTDYTANGSTHTITHNLGSTDVIVQIWISSASSGTNPQIVSGISMGGGSGRGATVTNLASTTCTVQLAADGFLDISTTGVGTLDSYASKYMKVVVLG